ncbi:MAG: hypothetical protein A3J29_04340 [Acidobacteria bacterium RIFCSPLOWO2_12_FULL_67_14b]|nr:MAG: hypothetical protein A3J29_04340 [Acidobacteria bacterium RIFCSPLOWO2_12_FULL_67_14b]
MLSVLAPALVGSMLLAVLSTVADYVWFRGIPQHQVSSGMIHGAVLFAALGAYLGWRKGKVGAGALGGLVSGTAAALSFYALAPIGGYPMMIVSWVLLWIFLAALQTHLDGRLDPARAIGRGVITSVAAGLGFAVVLFQLYRDWPPEAFPTFRHFVAWSMAYLPGLYVLLKR